MATTYLLTDIPPDVHADLKRAALMQHRTIKQVLLIAIDREIQRTLKGKRTSIPSPAPDRH